jgi:hypothetical protein
MEIEAPEDTFTTLSYPLVPLSRRIGDTGVMEQVLEDTVQYIHNLSNPKYQHPPLRTTPFSIAVHGKRCPSLHSQPF